MTVYATRLTSNSDTATRMRFTDLLTMPVGSNPLTSRSGLRPDGGGITTVVAGSMNVQVTSFMAWVQGGASVAQGGYPFVSDATVTLAVDPGHASLVRVDTVCAVVRENTFDNSGQTAATVEIVKGTPGSGAPALPTSAIPLQDITVPAGTSAGGGGLTASMLSTDRRVFLSLGPAVADFVALTPVGASNDAIYRTPRYRVTTYGSRKRVEMEGMFSYGGGGTAGASMFTMPVGLRPAMSDAHLCWSSNAAGSVRVDTMVDGTMVLRTATAAGVLISLTGIAYWTD